ncbi:hypothetical protein D3C72_2364350 [compost metagenome]
MPLIPAETTAATAAALEIPSVVLWVTWQACTTAWMKRSGSATSAAIPTGVMRIAAPLVVP